jgi:hypothetical protein
VGSIEDAFSRCTTLADAIVVGLRQSPAWEVVEVVIQDEYTHDVVFAPATPPAGAPAVVLDCT